MEDLIKLHEKAILILEAIESFKSRKRILDQSMKGMLSNFPGLLLKWEHKIYITEECIFRLKIYYMKHILKIKNSIQNGKDN